MERDDLALYRRWLKCGLESNKRQDKQYVHDSFAESIVMSSAYQADALVNGVDQPIVATRKDTKKCSFTVIPGDHIYIGDLVYVFNEHWICVDLYVDEFGMQYGELWMCNQVFRYQDHNLHTIEKYAILDDGSYSNGNDRAIRVADNSFNCYVSLDDESRALYIDKRLAIGIIHNSKGVPILEVGKIKWIDVKSRNFGEGSHLMLFGINDDPYNGETDNIDEMICDFIVETNSETPIPPIIALSGYIIIEGRTKIRIGSSRTYTVTAVDADGNSVDPPGYLEWQIDSDSDLISIQSDGDKCIVSVKEDSELSGVVFTLSCTNLTGDYQDAQIQVEVT